jgi:mono/diheme cytochrome c family protein
MQKRLIGIAAALGIVIGAIALRAPTLRAAAVASPPPGVVAEPTFNRDIAPILFQNCATCHHPGEVAPFPLLTYSDAKKHSSEIAELTHMRQMPPWKPEHGFGEFVGERRLSDQQIATIQQWVKTGRAEGNAADLPPQPKFAEGWVLGEPDLVVTVPKAFTLHGEGRDVFRSFAVPLNLSEDKYVEALEFRPSNRKIVHHALFFLDASGRARGQDGADGQPGFGRGAGGLGFIPSGGLGGWAPGVTPKRLPTGVGRVVKKGSDLVIQTHFHPSGKAETEQSTVGLYFAKKPPEKLFVSSMRGLPRMKLDIPPGDNHYELSDSFTVPADVKLQGVFPHAHLICKEVEVTATLPDGKKIPVIWIKDWDWDWQDEYLYSHPLDIPKGTQVHMRFRFDNSEANVKNPSKPPKRVRWGEQTSDEMAICFFQLVVDRSSADAVRSAMLRGDPANRERLKRWLESLRNNQKKDETGGKTGSDEKR